MEVTRLEFGPICINDHILKLNNKSLMSNNIYAALEQLGLAQKRAIHVQFQIRL
jgi:type VI secretion system secreted protein VgrG